MSPEPIYPPPGLQPLSPRDEHAAARKAGETTGGTLGRREANPANPRVQPDEVAVSADAQALSHLAGEEATSPWSGLPAARIRELEARLAQGFYRRTEVLERAATAIAAELQRLDPGNDAGARGEGR